MAGIDLLVVNATTAIQLVVYLLSLIIVGRLIVRPILRTLALRKQRLAVTVSGTGLEGDLTEKEARYAELLKEMRGAATKARQDLREEVKRAEQDILGDAQARLGAKVKEGRASLQASLSAARAELDQNVPVMARELARKILGREFSA